MLLSLRNRARAGFPAKFRLLCMLSHNVHCASAGRHGKLAAAGCFWLWPAVGSGAVSAKSVGGSVTSIAGQIRGGESGAITQWPSVLKMASLAWPAGSRFARRGASQVFTFSRMTSMI